MLSCRPAVIDFISPVVLKCVFKNALNIHKAIRYGFLLHSLLHHPSYGPRVKYFSLPKKNCKSIAIQWIERSVQLERIGQFVSSPPGKF